MHLFSYCQEFHLCFIADNIGENLISYDIYQLTDIALLSSSKVHLEVLVGQTLLLSLGKMFQTHETTAHSCAVK